MYEEKREGFWSSWPGIIILFIIFWPVGLYLLIKKLSKDKKATMGSGKVMGGFGITLYCFAIFAALGSLTSSEGNPVSTLLGSAFMMAGGYALRRLSKKTKKEAENVRLYLPIIINSNILELDTIASITGNPYDVVKKDVMKLIDKGFLKGAYIHDALRTIVLTERETFNGVNVPKPTYTHRQTHTLPRTVTCSCCGANNTIKSATGECEYCGSPIA